jgi:WD repeat-containing protein 76
MYHGGKSVNSAFFSPSGQYVVSTTQANRLDIFTDIHLANASSAKPSTSIRHNTQTGRWLTTLNAVWHPRLPNIFVVGNLDLKPRAMEIFTVGSKVERIAAVTGEALTAVASRCAFHPACESELVVVGGNSSGRVSVLRHNGF